MYWTLPAAGLLFLFLWPRSRLALWLLWTLLREKTIDSWSQHRPRTLPGCLALTYDYLGQRHTVYVPYKRGRMRLMSNLTVSLRFADGRTERLRQQAGVPYLVCPADLGAESAVLRYLDDEPIEIGRTEILDIERCRK